MGCFLDGQQAVLPASADVPDAALANEAAAAGTEEEAFLPEEEEYTDVSGFIDGGIDGAGEQEA